MFQKELLKQGDQGLHFYHSTAAFHMSWGRQMD